MLLYKKIVAHDFRYVPRNLIELRKPSSLFIWYGRHKTNVPLHCSQQQPNVGLS